LQRSRKRVPLSSSETQRERLRRRFCPAHVRLLFVGESPPASGRFFYQGDSGLYRAIRNAFRVVDPSIVDADFLTVFQNSGCYLIDTCLEPVDRLDPQSRRAACLTGEASLGRTIGKLQPEAIATVVRSVRGNVERAASCAGWHGPLIDLPYPGRWRHHQEIFLAQVVPVIRACLRASAANASEPSRERFAAAHRRAQRPAAL